MDMQTVKNRFDELKTSNQVLSVHPKIRGVIINLLDKACGSKDNRYQFAIALGLPAHSKDWTTGEWYAVSQMVKPDKDPAIGWIATEPNFAAIVGAIMTTIGANEKQIGMFDK